MEVNIDKRIRLDSVGLSGLSLPKGKMVFSDGSVVVFGHERVLGDYIAYRFNTPEGFAQYQDLITHLTSKLEEYGSE